jgi:hypothetical protein
MRVLARTVVIGWPACGARRYLDASPVWDVNDADRLYRDPAMRWMIGDRAITGSAASASQMGRFETRRLSRPENLAVLADLPAPA